MADLPLAVSGAGNFVHARRHPCFDEAGTNGVAADGGAAELVTDGLHKGNYGCFGGGVLGYGRGCMLVSVFEGNGRAQEDLQGPALERRPAMDAVAMMEPDEVGLEGEVRSIAFAAYLAARKTLSNKARLIHGFLRDRGILVFFLSVTNR